MLALLLSFAAIATAALADPQGVDARLDQLFGEHESYRGFLRDLKAAVAANSRGQVASMVSYPLRVRIAGKALHLRTPAQFLAHYDQLLPQKTRTAIANATYGALFANGQGAMLGDGQLWFSGVCTDAACNSRPVRIVGLNP